VPGNAAIKVDRAIALNTEAMKDAVGGLWGVTLRGDEDGKQVSTRLGHHSDSIDDREEVAVGQGCINEHRIPADDECVGARTAKKPAAGGGEADGAVEANRVGHVGYDAAAGLEGVADRRDQCELIDARPRQEAPRVTEQRDRQQIVRQATAVNVDGVASDRENAASG
jgi:hypothetical protein